MRYVLRMLLLATSAVIAGRVVISRWEVAALAQGEVFATIRPACTFVEVQGFIDPEWLVELEVSWVAYPDT